MSRGEQSFSVFEIEDPWEFLPPQKYEIQVGMTKACVIMGSVSAAPTKGEDKFPMRIDSFNKLEPHYASSAGVLKYIVLGLRVR